MNKYATVEKIAELAHINKVITHASIKDNFNISFFYGEDGKMEDAFAELNIENMIYR